jgi:hypothetical protein
MIYFLVQSACQLLYNLFSCISIFAQLHDLFVRYGVVEYQKKGGLIEFELEQSAEREVIYIQALRVYVSSLRSARGSYTRDPLPVLQPFGRYVCMCVSVCVCM